MAGEHPDAGTGAGIGAAGALAGGASTGSIGGLAVGVALLPLFALGGALYGAAASHSEAEIAQAQRNMAAALAETDVAGRIRAGMAATASGRATLEAVDDPAPAEFDQVLEVDVRSIGFTSSGIYDPDVTAWVFASARLRRTTDDACLYERLWLYRSTEQAYFTLADKDAQLMRAELQTAADRLAASMANDLFVATQPTVSKPPEGGRAAAIMAPNYISGCPSGSTSLKED
jgi:hypothetical protein